LFLSFPLSNKINGKSLAVLLKKNLAFREYKYMHQEWSITCSTNKTKHLSLVGREKNTFPRMRKKGKKENHRWSFQWISLLKTGTLQKAISPRHLFGDRLGEPSKPIWRPTSESSPH
jgi:hypothetical protein